MGATLLYREISLEDLLGRRQNRLNTKQISKNLINNKVILINRQEEALEVNWLRRFEIISKQTSNVGFK